AHDAIAGEMAFVVDGRVGLRDDEGFLAISGEIIDMVAHAAIFDFAIWRFEEAEIVDARKSGERRDQPNVRAFRRFDRADAPVMGRMDVADFEPGAVAREPAWPEGRKAALVGQFRQRIDLVHELRELAAAEEITDDRRKRLGIDE